MPSKTNDNPTENGSDALVSFQVNDQRMSYLIEFVLFDFIIVDLI